MRSCAVLCIKRGNHMNEIVSNLLVYGSLPEDSILWQLADICEKLKNQTESKDALRGRVFHQVKNLLTVATDYAFDKNLWHNYLTFLLITNENPFSLVCEKMGAQDGTVNNFVTHDFEMFKKLFDYDFSWMEKELSIDCFTQLTHYKAIRKKELMYNKNVSEKVRNLSEQLETAESGADFFKYVTEFYKDFGVGMFGLNKAFRIAENGDGSVRFLPINNMDAVMLDDLIGYELQKKKLVENTQAFCDGKAANNVLLFGDSGTGKSTSIKAIVNQFYPQGLRMIEIPKSAVEELSLIREYLADSPMKFIIYIDDLSFDSQDNAFTELKAALEGGLSACQPNTLIYATSNRRHLIKENFSDREDDVNKNDTRQEQLSLSDRFGLTITFINPDKKDYLDIVEKIAADRGLQVDAQRLDAAAEQWAVRRGGRSPRCARQFIDHVESALRRGKEW